MQQVRLLGPLEIAVDDAVRPIRGRRRQTVMAALALRAGEVVSVDWLIDLVWGAAPSPSAAHTLQSHVSHLRRQLGSGGAINVRPPGYVLQVDPDGVDVQVAQRLVQLGTATSDSREGARLLAAAVELWRGPPLAELAGLDWFDDQRHWLDALRVQADQGLIEHRLALGAHAALLPELSARCRRRALDEDAHRQLMLALYRSGRPADALVVYRGLQRALRGRLGLDPSQPLQDLHAAILRHDRSLDLADTASTRPANRMSGPAQAARHARPLVRAHRPAPLPVFASRERELARLDAAIFSAATGIPGSVVISAVDGSAGVGKPPLAVAWVHRVVDRFPDGQLYANLRGFDPRLPPREPAEVLRCFLTALAVPSARVPSEFDALVGLYRSVLAGKRVLVVLDDARDVEQVRPLLPNSPGSLTVVTSRDQMIALVVAEGARLDSEMTVDFG